LFRRIATLTIMMILAAPAAVHAVAASAEDAPDVSQNTVPQEHSTASTIVEQVSDFTAACVTCHAGHTSGHPGTCESCHDAALGGPNNEHPVFEPIADGTCIGCHQKGTLP